MAAKKSVIVLVPNGRRQNVPVTANTTMLQVLEEVCKKHGYDPDDYDFKHFNNILDVNAIFRFTGLPNNAQLEMVKCTKKRKVSNVTICLQLETGDRLTGDFTTNSSLKDVLSALRPGENLETAVIIYMHREINGDETLEKTTLRSLGLSNGRAMLRLIHRDPEQPKPEIRVHTPSSLKSKKPDDSMAQSSSSRKKDPILLSKPIIDPISLIKQAKMEETGRQFIKKPDHEPKQKISGSLMESVVNEIKIEKGKEKEVQVETKMEVEDIPTETVEDIEFLGEREALVFDHSRAENVPGSEIPDDFFNVTIEDARILLRDVIRQREQLEDAPLVTSSLRQLDTDKKILSHLHKYRKSVIRIQFPDQLVLQGIFGLLEPVETIKEFVKLYLEDPESEFTLYTAPPRKDLNLSARLIEENLVPSAVIYFSGTTRLKEQLREKLVDQKSANIQANKWRLKLIRNDEDSNIEIANSSVMETSEPQASTSRNENETSKSKVPKWFKGSFK